MPCDEFGTSGVASGFWLLSAARFERIKHQAMGELGSPRLYGFLRCRRCGAVNWMCRLRAGGFIAVERRRVPGGNLDLIASTGKLVPASRERHLPRFTTHNSVCPVTRQREAERALREAIAGQIASAIAEARAPGQLRLTLEPPPPPPLRRRGYVDLREPPYNLTVPVELPTEGLS